VTGSSNRPRFLESDANRTIRQRVRFRPFRLAVASPSDPLIVAKLGISRPEAIFSQIRSIKDRLSATRDLRLLQLGKCILEAFFSAAAAAVFARSRFPRCRNREPSRASLLTRKRHPGSDNNKQQRGDQGQLGR
jgi:hypothetical protein